MSSTITEMPFGKYAGHPITQLQTTYLAYTLENSQIDIVLFKVLKAELDKRLKIAEDRILNG